MEIVDGINLGITIGLGVLSLGVSILSVILSLYFARESSNAFDKIKELTNEIRALTSNTFTNQQKYSDKMLDTILQQTKFGEPSKHNDSKVSDATLKIITTEVKKELEGTINSKLDEAKESLKLSTQVRTNISRSIETAQIDYKNIKQKFELPKNIKTGLETFKEFPAHYVLLRGIVLSESKSVSDIAKHANEYSIPSGWDNGSIDKFFKIGLLVGNYDSFRIPDELIKPLYFWIDKNKDTFNKIIKIYKGRESEGITDEEQLISMNEFKF